MGNSISTSKPDSRAPSSSNADVGSTVPGQGECPAVGVNAQQGGSLPSTSSCPIPEQYRAQPIYNVYGQRIDAAAKSGGAGAASPLDVLARYSTLDPTNQMPAEPNQQPFPGQRLPLSTDRQPSSIPKDGTSSTWVYPSPQMFYNALKRKGKGADVTEQDMDAVVYNHNVMNELTWRMVEQWERLHAEQCAAPKLVRFLGRPDKKSPRAWLRGMFGDPTWFDRHDWYVDRCGKEVRYVIDFYFDESRAGQLEAFEVDARPALDSPEAALDRVKMSVYKTFARYGLPCPISGHAGQIVGGDNPGGSNGNSSSAGNASSSSSAA